MAIVTPCPGSWRDVKTQRLRRKSKKSLRPCLYLLLFVLFPSVFFLNNLLLPQPACFQHLVGHFDTLCCQPSSPSPKPQTLSCLQRELQAQPNVNNHSMQCERRIQNTCCLLPGGQHHPSRPFSCGISGPDPRQPAGRSGARQGETSPEVQD